MTNRSLPSPPVGAAVERRAVEMALADVRGAGAALLAGGAALAMLPAGAGVPCPLRTVTGIPCPLCGMTTSVTETMSFDLPAALAANPAGVAAVVVAVVALIAPRLRVSVPGWLAASALAAAWIYQLNRFDLI